MVVVVVVLVLTERERVLTVGVFGIEEEEEERRERLAERVMDEDEGAAEEASARFRLRVSIQNPDSPFQFLRPLTDRLIPCICALSDKEQIKSTKTLNPKKVRIGGRTNTKPP